MTQTKHKRAQKSARKWQLPVLLMMAVFVMVGVATILSGVLAPRHPLVAVITPQTYISTFLETNRAHVLLDVRRADEFAGGHIAGAVNISIETLANNLKRVPKDMPIVLYCRSGNRSAQAANLLAEAGYDEIYDLGGIIEWQRQNLPVVR